MRSFLFYFENQKNNSKKIFILEYFDTPPIWFFYLKNRIWKVKNFLSESVTDFLKILVLDKFF